ncbi:MAG: hypothetical protein IGBAC_1895 [Ignavibacteriae bacterium]|nr:MAG: hypothetical protein IGBAC_1895 [Ignavibacteriota bacterium]
MTICEHTCKGLCKALELAIEQESKSIQSLKNFFDECDYPDVKILLNDIITAKEKYILLLKDKAEDVRIRFNTLDQIGESF